MNSNWKKRKGKLSQEFVFKDFKDAISFVNRTANIAEKSKHHPDIYIYDYKRVRLDLFTKDKNKITKKDTDLAKKIDAELMKPKKFAM